MTECDSTETADATSGGHEHRRDWFGRFLERLSRQGDGRNAEPDAQQPRFTPQLMLAVLALAIAAGVTIGLIITSRGDETALEATRMTLELTYPTAGDQTANLEGQPNAAPANVRIVCRATSDEQRLGEGRATGDGSFDIPLDPAIWPLDAISGSSFETLNETLECRAGTGPWVQPLRPPRVAIN